MNTGSQQSAVRSQPLRCLTEQPIDVAEWHRLAIDARDGASVEFLGVVRATEDDQPIVGLRYEAYEPMAERLIGRLIEQARVRWTLHRACVQHRLGRVAVGEIAVLVGVQAPHRQEALTACQFLIDGIKQDVPIWKQTVRSDGVMQSPHPHADRVR